MTSEYQGSHDGVTWVHLDGEPGPDHCFRYIRRREDIPWKIVEEPEKRNPCDLIDALQESHATIARLEGRLAREVDDVLEKAREALRSRDNWKQDAERLERELAEARAALQDVADKAAVACRPRR